MPMKFINTDVRVSENIFERLARIEYIPIKVPTMGLTCGESTQNLVCLGLWVNINISISIR